MLDNEKVNNNFYRKLQSNFANTDQVQAMALELHHRARIQMSGADNQGLSS